MLIGVFYFHTKMYDLRKKVVIPSKVIIGGFVIEVCEDCLKKYDGKKIEVTDVDKIIKHTDLIKVISIGD